MLLSAEMTPAEFIRVLIENEDYPDVVRFIAYALPKREATWWACLCARSCLSEHGKATDQKAIELAEAWVYKPTPEHCQPNYQAAEATAFKTPAGWAAMAAFWSGDNISPVKGNVVPPSADLPAKAVSGAVMLAAVQEGPEKIKERYQRFIQQGIDIAGGGDGRKI
nr:hypothetical protein [Methylomarinum sp. Ch1-1]MDP4520098.1 hypothetical protein [Methylomarinum sp. Ch1-1]